MLGMVSAVLKNTALERRFSALNDLALTIPDEYRGIFDAVRDVIQHGITDDPQSTIVVLVHGIRTDAAWQNRVRFEFKDDNLINVIPTGYGFFNAFNFWWPFRAGPVERIKRELRDVRYRDPKARIVVIAHSFGTYIVSKLLATISDLQVERIILCGAVVPRDFRWDLYSTRLNNSTILNDVGTDDHYPVLATYATLGYGSSGRLGFQTARVTDRFFKYGHSDFLTSEHIKKYWRPFVLEGKIISSEWDANRTTTPYIINILSMGPWIPGALLVLMIYLIYFLFKNNNYF